MDSFPSPAVSTYMKSAPPTTTTHVLLPQPPHHRSSATVTTHKLPNSSSSTSYDLNNSAQTFQSKGSFQLVNPLKPRQSSPVPFSSPVHRRAASGYAAALIDSAQFDSTLVALEKDVRRLSHLLGGVEVRDFMRDQSVNDEDKGGLLKVILKKGKFRGELQAVVNLLVDKGKFGIVWEVLDEFERIYGELKFGMVKKMKGYWGRRDSQIVGHVFAA